MLAARNDDTPADRDREHGPCGKASHLACLAWLCVVLLSGPARANPQDIEEGEPVTLEDAFTDPAGQLSLQYSGAYGRTRQDGTQTLLEQGPTFKLGAMPGVQVSLNPNYDSGSVQGKNSGFVLGDVLVQLNGQNRILPTFAADIFESVPFGAGHKSAGTVFRLIASKFLGASEDAPRLHVNFTDTRIVEPEPGGRRNQLVLAFGGSVLVAAHDAIVADLVTGAAEEAGRRQTFLEIGYSRDLPEDWTAQLGIGRQVAGTGQGVRVFFAIEKELQIYGKPEAK